MWTPKNGCHLVCKMQFQAKICTFYVKITAKFVNSQNVHKARKNVSTTFHLAICHPARPCTDHPDPICAQCPIPSHWQCKVILINIKLLHSTECSMCT